MTKVARAVSLVQAPTAVSLAGTGVLVGVSVGVKVGVMVGVYVAVLTGVDVGSTFIQVSSARATPVPGCPTL